MCKGVGDGAGFPVRAGLDAGSEAAGVESVDYVVAVAGDVYKRQFLQDRAPGRSGQATIRNDQTRYSVVFEPKARVLHIAVLETPESAAQYTTVSLRIGDSP